MKMTSFARRWWPLFFRSAHWSFLNCLVVFNQLSTKLYEHFVIVAYLSSGFESLLSNLISMEECWGPFNQIITVNHSAITWRDILCIKNNNKIAIEVEFSTASTFQLKFDGCGFVQCAPSTIEKWRKKKSRHEAPHHVKNCVCVNREPNVLTHKLRLTINSVPFWIERSFCVERMHADHGTNGLNVTGKRKWYVCVCLKTVPFIGTCNCFFFFRWRKDGAVVLVRRSKWTIDSDILHFKLKCQ